MAELEDLTDALDFVKNDQLNGPIFATEPLLHRNIWQEAYETFNALIPDSSSLPLEQQQYLSDLRLDLFLHDTLRLEFEIVRSWLKEHPNHPEALRSQHFLARSSLLRHRSEFVNQQALFIWSEANAHEDLAVAIHGLRRLARGLADHLIDWSDLHPEDPRACLVRLWNSWPGFYPQNRLKIWALRFSEDTRAGQILLWDSQLQKQIHQTHPELLEHENHEQSIS